MLRHSLLSTVFAFSLVLGTASYGIAQTAAAPAAGSEAQPQPAAAVDGAAAMSAGVTTAAPDATPPSQEPEEPKQEVWKFKGITGYVDKQAAQRGFQVYKQVCSACHSMNLVAYRSLSKIGFTEAEIKAAAGEKQVEDYNDKGERYMRKALPSDNFVPPYANENASRAANGGAYPPDLSLIIKARKAGPDYVYSLLTGFGKAPDSETPVANKYYDPYFTGHWVSMPPPLSDNVVTYQDGTPATVDQMARDVVTFLEWAAEPEMEARHEMGVKVLLFLIIMTGFLYAAKKRVWKTLEKD